MKKGYKNTEVGVIPEDWKVVEIRDILELLTDFDSNGSFASVAENVNVFDNPNYAWYVRSTDLENNTDINNVKYIDKSSYDFLKKTKLYGNELFFLKRGDIGNVYYFEMKTKYASLAPNLYLLKLNNKTKSLYQYYYFLSNFGQRQLKSKNASSTLGALYKEDVKQIKIPLPTLKEQQAIATVLSDTDSLLSSLKTLIAKKKAIKQGTMQELLTGKKRLKGFTGEWDSGTLGGIAEIKRGASPRPIKDPIWFNKKSKVGWVRISDVTKSNKYLTKTVQKLSEEGIANSRYVSSENLIMSICATIGRPILTKINVCIHDGFVVFNSLKLEKEFLYYFLTFIEGDWGKNGQTSSQMNLNTTLINNTKIVYPKDKKEQQAIAQILTDIDKEIEALESQLQKTENLKQGLMQELLTGKIRLVQPEIENKLGLVAEPRASYGA